MSEFNANHHLSESVLMAYAAGTLPEAFSLVVACHISMCDECRATLESLEAVGGTMLENGATEAMSDDAFERTMALIDGGDKIEVKRPVDPSGILPAPLVDYVGGGLDSIKWSSVGGGIKQSILETSGGGTARLLRIGAGVAVPDHGHRGLELTLVLKGAFSDDSGRFARGDVECREGAHSHKPVADIHEDCICLAATDAPLRFDGIIPRMMQPFIKI